MLSRSPLELVRLIQSRILSKDSARFKASEEAKNKLEYIPLKRHERIQYPLTPHRYTIHPLKTAK